MTIAVNLSRDFAEEYARLLKTLLEARSTCEEFRVLLADAPASEFPSKVKVLNELSDHLFAWEIVLHDADHVNREMAMPFVQSAVLSLQAAEIMMHRLVRLSESTVVFPDEGHRRLLDKQILMARRRAVDLCRESRESCHVAYFLLNKKEPHVKPS